MLVAVLVAVVFVATVDDLPLLPSSNSCALFLSGRSAMAGETCRAVVVVEAAPAAVLAAVLFAVFTIAAAAGRAGVGATAVGYPGCSGKGSVP